MLLLVATDVDALCAAHMLVDMLTIDCVGYRVRPVSGWPDMEKAFAEEIYGNEEVRSPLLFLPRERMVVHAMETVTNGRIGQPGSEY